MDKSNLIVGNGIGIFFLILSIAQNFSHNSYNPYVTNGIPVVMFYGTLLAGIIIRKRDKKPGVISNVIHNVCSICGQTINAPQTSVDLARTQPYFMGVDYADRLETTNYSRIYDQRLSRDNWYDERLRRYQELMASQVALQPPQPIILQTQQNRQPNANANNNIYDPIEIQRIYANNYGSNGQPPPKPEVKEPPKVEPIPPRNILSAISTLELGE